MKKIMTLGLVLGALAITTGCPAGNPATNLITPESTTGGTMLPGGAEGLPTLTETAELTAAPKVPPPIQRKQRALVKVNLETSEVDGVMLKGIKQDT